MKTSDLRHLLFTVAILGVLALFTSNSAFAGGATFEPGPPWSWSFDVQEPGAFIGGCRATDTSSSDLNDFCRIDKKGNKYCHINDHDVDIEYWDVEPAIPLYKGPGTLNVQCWGQGCGPGTAPDPQKNHNHTILIMGEVIIDGETFHILCHDVHANNKRPVGKIKLH